jgi:hypothetical protein
LVCKRVNKNKFPHFTSNQVIDLTKELGIMIARDTMTELVKASFESNDNFMVDIEEVNQWYKEVMQEKERNSSDNSSSSSSESDFLQSSNDDSESDDSKSSNDGSTSTTDNSKDSTENTTTNENSSNAEDYLSLLLYVVISEKIKKK